MTSPFSEEKWWQEALVLTAVIHVHEADEFGNARIMGSAFQDISDRAARKTIITAERIVDTESFRKNPERTSVPHFLVEAVVLAPHGAKPGTCFGEYDFVDDGGMKAYLKAVKEDTLDEYLADVTEGRA